MGIIRDLFGRDEEIDTILEENKQLKRKKRSIAEELDELKEEHEDIVKKYIAILEEKSTGFDQYLKYQDMYKEIYTQDKERKKEVADLKIQVKNLEEELSKKGKRRTKNEEDKI